MDLLLLTGRADREDTLGVAKPALALVAVAVLPPQHGLAQRALRGVVRRLDRLVEKGPQRRPQLEQVPARPRHPLVGRCRATLEQTPKLRLDVEHPAFELFPTQRFFAVNSPALEHPVTDLLALGREVGRQAAAQPQLLEVSRQVRPADLPFRPSLVRAPPVAADNPFEVAEKLL